MKNSQYKILIITLLMIQVSLSIFVFTGGLKNVFETQTDVSSLLISAEDLAREKASSTKAIQRKEKLLNRQRLIDGDGLSASFASADPKKLSEHVYGGIVPHHLFVKDWLASYFLSLKDFQYETVVIIGPNHFNAGINDIQTANTLNGFVDVNEEMVIAIASSGLAILNNDIFGREHSIGALLPFIARTLPQARVVPIIVKPSAKQADLEKLAQYLRDNVDRKKTLVLASVDFSHYQSLAVADFHDEQSMATIEAFNLPELSQLEVDSPNSLYAVMQYLNLVSARSAQLSYHTNSSRLLGREDEPSTSHCFYYFSAKDNVSEVVGNFDKNISALFFGDVMLDRYVDKLIQVNGFDYLLSGLAGEEKRFFMGPDLVSLNLEGAVFQDGVHTEPTLTNDFSFRPEIVKQLSDYGFNYFTTANNHVTDQGAEGVKQTWSNLDQLRFDYSGCADQTVDDCSGRIIEHNGVRLGMVAFSQVYGLLDEEKVSEKIKEIKKLSDYVIVNIHWGKEYQSQFNAVQQNLAHKMIDGGADLIIGHHPHVVQGAEIYEDKYIFYSLGNFIFDQFFSAETQTGLAVGINIDNEKMSAHLFPFRGRKARLAWLQGDEKKKFLDKFIQVSDQVNVLRVDEQRLNIKP